MTDEESGAAFSAWARGHCDGTNRDIAAEAWIAAIAWMQSQQEWRSMDSAPVGRDMILCHNGEDQIVACWDEHALDAEHHWCTHDGHYHDNEFIGWLPLPPLPKETK